MLRLFLRPFLLLLLGLFGLWFSLSLSLPLTAQSLFATNTPAGTNSAPTVPLLPFATNTPFGGIPTATPLPTATPQLPASAIFNYSLRQWLEQDLITLTLEQIQKLDAQNVDTHRAVDISLYELGRRVTGAPRSQASRQQLIEALMQAPIGVVDLRPLVRPYIINAVNVQANQTEQTISGFSVSIRPANLDNRGRQDAVIAISYRDALQELYYEEFVLVLGQDDGTYQLLPWAYDLAAAPFNGIRRIFIDQVADVNRDGVDEVVLRVRDADVNVLLLILGVRNNEVVSMTRAGDEIRFGEIVSWNLQSESAGAARLTVMNLSAQGTEPDWACRSQIQYFWDYQNNFYQRSQDLNARFTNQASLACDLLAAEPIFSLPTREAIQLIESKLLSYGFDAPSASRAIMTLAMLYTLEGRLEDARNIAHSIIPADNAETWEAQQANALLTALDDTNSTALDVCEALAEASIYPACDMDAVLGQYLDVLSLRTNENLSSQLDFLGLQVLNEVRVAEIGKADRIAIQFDLAGTSWWGFVAQRDGTYLHERMDSAPEGFESPNFVENELRVPNTAYQAFIRDNDPASALDIIANLKRDNPNRPLAAEGLYLQAFALELTGAREQARQLYYEVWEKHPETVWGQLGAAHLVLR